MRLALIFGKLAEFLRRFICTMCAGKSCPHNTFTGDHHEEKEHQEV